MRQNAAFPRLLHLSSGPLTGETYPACGSLRGLWEGSGCPLPFAKTLTVASTVTSLGPPRHSCSDFKG